MHCKFEKISSSAAICALIMQYIKIAALLVELTIISMMTRHNSVTANLFGVKSFVHFLLIAGALKLMAYGTDKAHIKLGAC